MNLNRTCAVHDFRRLPSEAPIVFVVDADATTRASLESMIRSAAWLPRAVACAEELLSLPRPTAPSCLLTELTLPGLSGLELQQRLVDRTEMPIILMSQWPDVRATVRAMKAGAFEVLTKPIASDVLLDTLELAIERSRVELRQLERTRALLDRYESLSRREREVMSLVVAGRLNKQVGGELGISEITVKAHRGKLMRKMQAKSFAELVNMATSLGHAARAQARDVGTSHAFMSAGDGFRAMDVGHA